MYTRQVRWTVTSQLYLGEHHQHFLNRLKWNRTVPRYNYLPWSTSPLLSTCGTRLGGSRLLHSAYRYLCPKSKRIKQWSNYLAHSAIYLTPSWCTRHYSTILIAGMSKAIHSKWPKWPDVITLWSSRCYIKKISQHLKGRVNIWLRQTWPK